MHSHPQNKEQPLNGFRALLLAGGIGSRLRPITEHTPKCLVPIQGRPLLSYWIDSLCDNGIEKILINTHYLADQVEAFCGNHRQKNRIELIFEPQLNGTAGTLFANRHFFSEEPFLFAHADNLSAFSIASFVETFKRRGSEQIGTMMTFQTEMPSECGIATVDEAGLLIDYVEKPSYTSSNLANAAVFLFDNRVHTYLSNNDPPPYDFCAEVVPLLKRKLNVFHNAVYHRDIGTTTALQQANHDVLDGRLTPVD